MRGARTRLTMISNQEHARPCPACKSGVSKYVGTKNGFEIIACGDCSTLFTTSLPTELETQDYDEYYDSSNLTVPEFIKRRGREIVSDFEAYRKENRFLEIGFGAGTILEAAESAGWEVFGQEVSRPAVEHANARGFNTFLGELHEANYPDEYFDVVIASEIIEHLVEPEKVLAEIRRILRPGGVFWGTTPFARSISYRVMGIDWSTLSPPEHLQLYSIRGIKGMLERAGFSTVKLRTTGANPMEIASYLRSFLKSKDEEQPQTFDRVQSAYKLNEQLTTSRRGLWLKNATNGILDLLKIGDSLKILAKH